MSNGQQDAESVANCSLCVEDDCAYHAPVLVELRHSIRSILATLIDGEMSTAFDKETHA